MASEAPIVRYFPESKYGRTTPGPVIMLPELAIDMSEGRPLPSNLGRTEVPMSVIEGLPLDLGSTVPALQLRLTLRTGATPGQVAVDLFRLYAAVNQLDLTQGGTGLMPGEATYDEPTANGTLWVTFRPADPQGATGRLVRIISAINQVHDFASLKGLEAKVVSVGA
jgi:hypothetical protein